MGSGAGTRSEPGRRWPRRDSSRGKFQSARRARSRSRVRAPSRARSRRTRPRSHGSPSSTTAHARSQTWSGGPARRSDPCERRAPRGRARPRSTGRARAPCPAAERRVRMRHPRRLPLEQRRAPEPPCCMYIQHRTFAPTERSNERDTVVAGDADLCLIREIPYLPFGAHLVGSVPLATAEAVFRTLSAGLGDRLRRIPDGETGPRADWIVWQYPVLSSRPQFEVAPPAPHSYRALPRLRLRPGEDGADLTFERLGYAEAAASSLRTFGLLKRDGELPRGCRFQVSLPTPLAPVSAFVALEHQPVVERAYESAMAVELQEILAAVPHDQLALQWDTNFEFGMLEGDVPAWFPDVKGGILERLIRMSRLVPPDVELGFHFCSGHDQAEQRHIPADMSRMVDIANALAASLDRPLNWVHMPVPRERDDAGFVAPLRDLRLQPSTELYLGLV